MSGISIAEFLDALPEIKAKVDEFFAAIEAASPGLAQEGEEFARAAIQTALSALDLPAIEGSLAKCAAVVKAGHGIAGGGADSRTA